MIWLVVVGIWWLVRHAVVNWYAFAGVALCIVLLMWWVIMDDRRIRGPLVPPED